ncbi:DUF58 domain-containing protein [Enemella dayhoffiae]|uniref:DUF58 domain-containing protein n=1 Tax=Enemella dayhoffiae TaxID=2016507 RepID=A0A255HC18_9ACTN|nr:DUF58 domain-containing protein [Enemella dayhoffiae]OYO25271.1 DUF58 domain-containing protein [Enemella dayhoffiae]
MALLTKVKTRMAIHAHRKVRGLLDGAYASLHSGRSMDFHDLREYVAGDEVRDLDWKASARRGELLVRRYVADRKHTISLVVSTSRSMAGHADLQSSKQELAIMVAGIIGWLAVKHGDRVLLVAGNSAGCRLTRPGSTEIALERMLQLVQQGCTESAPSADLTGLLGHVVRTVRRSTILLVICDDVALDAASERQLRRLRAQHEVLFVTLADLDPTAPELRQILLWEVDSGQPGVDFLTDPALHAELAEATVERHRQRRETLDRLGIASEHVTGAEQVVPAVFRLLERHRHATR